MIERVLVLGPLISNKNDVTGGAVVLFNSFLQELRRSKIAYELIDTNKKNYSNNALAPLFIIFKILAEFRKCKRVVFHSSRDYLYLLPVIYIINLAFGKDIYIRKFGGELDKELLKPIKGWYVRLLLRNATGVFVESRYLLNLVKSINSNSYWFPNVRPNHVKNFDKAYEYKFVFISQIKASKGIKELITAFESLDPKYSLGLYGPIMEPNIIEHIKKVCNISYNGVLNSEQVLTVISESDFVVLPTYYEGEGYPGIIIEAYSCGRPVIATRWKHIPEIVTHNETGFLVEPKSVKSLVDVIKQIEAKDFKELSISALNKFSEFEATSVTSKVLDIVFNK